MVCFVWQGKCTRWSMKNILFCSLEFLLLILSYKSFGLSLYATWKLSKPRQQNPVFFKRGAANNVNLVKIFDRKKIIWRQNFWEIGAGSVILYKLKMYLSYNSASHTSVMHYTKHCYMPSPYFVDANVLFQYSWLGVLELLQIMP